MPNINLLPSEKGSRKKLGSVLFLIVIGFLWIGVCYWLFVEIQKEIEFSSKDLNLKQEEVASLEKELTAINLEINSLPTESKEVIIIEKNLEIINQKNVTVFPEIFPFLLGLSGATPEGAWITKLETKNELCRVEGYAFRAQDVSDFLKNTKRVDGVARVKLVEVKRELFPSRKIPLHHFKLEVVLGEGRG